MTEEKYPGYCGDRHPGIIGGCISCTKANGSPPTNMWTKSHESRMNRIDALIKKLAYQAENPPEINLSIQDKAIWEDYTHRCRDIEQELQELGVEL